jgi:glycosyltransferase involved in cell wall biosynthesis
VPGVTVVTAVYNGERFLRPAIESILAQTYRDFEFVIVDDGSTDRSVSVVESYEDPRIRLVALGRNTGLPAALNAGLGAARGDLVARQDADDLAHPERLERQVAFLQAQPDVALVGSRGHLMDEDGRALGLLDRALEDTSIRWYHLLDNAFVHTSVMFRRAIVWEELGGYDASLPSSEDYDLWGRVLRSHRAANLPERLVTHRLSRASKMAGDENPGPKRARFHEILRRLVCRHLDELLEPGLLSADEAYAIGGFAIGVDSSDVGRFLAVFRRLLRRFGQLHPGCFRSRDFRRTVARQIDAAAFRLVPPGRLPAARVYGDGMWHHPSLIPHLPWLRAVSLVLLGRAGRGWLRRVRTSVPA